MGASGKHDMTCAWGDERAFDGLLLGAPNAFLQTAGQGRGDYNSFDVDKVLGAMEDAFAPGSVDAAGLAAFTQAVRASVAQVTGTLGRDRSDDGELPFVWLGPLLPQPGGSRGTDDAALWARMTGSTCPVALGLADTSIAFANRRFRKPALTKAHDRTRFKMLWLQDRYFDPASEFHGASPYSGILGQGTLLLEDDINAVFAKHWHDGALDEEAVYREFSSVRKFGRDLWSMRAGHGTSVLDLMAGADTGEPGSERDIYAVELPTAVVADTSGGLFHGPMLHGLAVVSLFSFVMSKRAPLVMNVSMSYVGGPHTGFEGSDKAHPTAKALNRLVVSSSVGTRSAHLMLPAGNNLQDRLSGTGRTATWVVPPNDRTGSTLEIWRHGFKGFSTGAKATLSLASPGSAPVPLAALPAPGHFREFLCDGQEIARLFRIRNDRQADHLVLGIFPTESHDSHGQISPAGFWTVRLKGADGQFFSSRDDTLAGLPEAGRQSWLRDESYRKFRDGGDWRRDSDIGRQGTRRDGSVSVLATGKLRSGRGFKAYTTLITGFEHSASEGAVPYRFAGLELGRVTHPGKARGAPAPMAEISRALGGPLAAARMGRGTIRWAGTSMASALAARQIADDLTKVSTLDAPAPREPAHDY
ncbi:hypothetical protein [Silicimonas sp. MF1-12-2]|uniref:hypothetical protein n=1 Tax=Silicimonas sp. MF1-12-2 TaxID=3384793 RepID=UPI0039B68240